MKLRSKLSLGLASLAVAAAGSWVAAAAQQTPSPAPPAPQAPAKPQKGETDKRPRLEKALEELRAIKQHLEKAPHDFGGHRVKAIEAVSEAIKQIELAAKFDKN
jgi:Spy/CpxP family protein refolding chaperone